MIPTLVDQSKRRAEEARRLRQMVRQVEPERPQPLPGGFAVAMLVWIAVLFIVTLPVIGRWAGWW